MMYCNINRLVKSRLNPARNYLLKVYKRNTRTRCEIRSKLTIKTPERRHWHTSGVFIVNFEHVNAVWISSMRLDGRKDIHTVAACSNEVRVLPPLQGNNRGHIKTHASLSSALKHPNISMQFCNWDDCFVFFYHCTYNYQSYPLKFMNLWKLAFDWFD